MSHDQEFGYSEQILHLPTEQTGPIKEVIDLLGKVMKLELKDDRTYIGTFTAFDKFGNFVLKSADEYFREFQRKINIVIVPLDYVTKVSVSEEKSS